MVIYHFIIQFIRLQKSIQQIRDGFLFGRDGDFFLQIYFPDIIDKGKIGLLLDSIQDFPDRAILYL